MTYQYDRHESSAAQKTDSELVDALKVTHYCIKMLQRVQSYEYVHPEAKALAKAEEEFWTRQRMAVIREIKKRV